MSAAGRSLLTSSTWAPPALLPVKHVITRMAAPRHNLTVRASVVRQESSSPDVRCTDVSASQPFPYRATTMQQEDVLSCHLYRTVQHLQQSRPVPHGMADITNTFLAGVAAVAASGQLHRCGYEWAESVLVVMAWRQVLAAQQKPAAEEVLWAEYPKPAAISSLSTRETEQGLEKAERHMKSTAYSFSWQLLDALNANGYEQGLAYEQLPLQLQVFTYQLLLKCGCIGAWGQPVYRKLPAIAATIRPGVIAAIPLQQYLRIAQHIPTICRDEMDGTWGGDAQIRIHPFQVVSTQEVGKALGPDMLLELFKSRSGFAADLAAVGGKLGLIDGVTAAACISNDSRSLAELLLLKISKALLGINAAAIVSMRRLQQQVSSTAQTAAVAATDDPDGSASLTCACGGAGGSRHGSITAVGSDGYSDDELGAGLVAVCKGGQDIETTTIAASADKDSSRRGLLHRATSLFRRLFRH